MLIEQQKRPERVRFRHPIRVVTVNDQPRVIRTLTGNLSREGLFLRMPEPLPMGTKVGLSLEAGGRALAFAQAEVMWQEHDEFAMPDIGRGCGVRFTQFMHPRAGELVEFLVDNLDRGRPLTLPKRSPLWARVRVPAVTAMAALFIGILGIPLLSQVLAPERGAVPESAALSEPVEDGAEVAAAEGASSRGAAEVAATAPADREPRVAPAVAPEPATGGPVAAQPLVASEPVAAGPAAAGPVAAQPHAVEPVAAGSVAEQRVAAAETVVAPPVGAEAVAAEPVAAQPVARNADPSPPAAASAEVAQADGASRAPAVDAAPTKAAAPVDEQVAAVRPLTPTLSPLAQGEGGKAKKRAAETGTVKLPTAAAPGLAWKLSGTELRLSPELGGQARVTRSFLLEGPPRVVFDVSGAQPKKSLTVNASPPYATSVRLGKQAGGTRIVVDLDKAPRKSRKDDGALVLSF